MFTTFLLGGSLIFTSVGTEFPQSQSQPATRVVQRITGGSDREEGNYIIRIVDRKKVKFDLSFHMRLEKYFPDWNTRIIYQGEREKFYDSAMKKRREALRLRTKENWSLTDQEQDAIDYFSGRGFYEEHQDLRKKPNIFDNRQSFLFKMHNKEMRDNFLKSYNQIENN